MSLISSLNSSAGSLSKFQAAAAKAASGLGRIKSEATGASAPLDRVKSSAAAAEKAVANTGKAGAASGGLMGRFKQGLGLATTGMKGLNTAMKANMLGILMMLLAPLIQKIIDMAMQSKTMQKVMKVAFETIHKVIAAVMKAIGPIMKSAGEMIANAWNGIKHAIEVVVQWVWTAIQFYFNAYKTVIMTVMHVVVSIVSGTWNGIRDAISGVLHWISSATSGAFNAVRDALHGAWSGLAGFASSAFNNILGAVKAPLNAVIGLVNSAIGALNNIHVSVPDWVPGLGGKGFGINLPKIPMLANGGIIAPTNGGTLAVVGEAGQHEAVIPLDRLDRMLSGGGANASALHRLAAAMEALAERPVQIEVDSQVIARATMAGQRQLARR